MKSLILVITSILFYACSSDRPVGKTEAEIIFKEAKDLIADGQYTIANQKLNQIKSHHPYSFYATKAELLSADIYYRQENYLEASSAYLIFKDMHPSYKKIDYVYLRIADSFFMQRPSTYDRDLNSCHHAIRYYDEFLLKFSNSKHKEIAIENKSRCNEMIKMKERYIADFYFKTKVYDAAIFRYQNILKQFSDQNLRQHSMTRIIRSYSFLKKIKECNDYASRYKSKLSAENLGQLKGICTL